MDVQAATASATFVLPAAPQSAPAQPPPSGSASPGAPAAGVPSASIPNIASSDGSNADPGSSGSTANPAIGQTPGLATLPVSDGKKGSQVDPSLSSGIAHLYNAQEQNVSVSFQVEQNPNEIVTVFTDKQTGKVIVQFPSETLIALAKFFDKLDGSVVNQKV